MIAELASIPDGCGSCYGVAWACGMMRHAQVLGVTNGDLPASAKEEMKKPKKRLKCAGTVPER